MFMKLSHCCWLSEVFENFIVCLCAISVIPYVAQVWPYIACHYCELKKSKEYIGVERQDSWKRILLLIEIDDNVMLILAEVIASKRMCKKILPHFGSHKIKRQKYRK